MVKKILPLQPRKLIIFSIFSGNCEIKVTSGDHVTYWRTGYLLTGQQIEDKQTDTIIVENTTTMSHLEKSLLGLCVEDKRSVILHSTATFSDRPKSIPLGATVVYDIRVENIARQSEVKICLGKYLVAAL